jgi:toxin ParE1/3/4
VTPVWIRPAAEADLVERSRYYLDQAGDEVAYWFFDAALATLRAIERMPGTGSPRVGELCDIPGLRVGRIKGFPCGWFYFVRPDHVDVVRLLADAQDIAVILNTDIEEE